MTSDTETALRSRRCTGITSTALWLFAAVAGCDRQLLIGTIPANDPPVGSGGNGVVVGGTGGAGGAGGTMAPDATATLIPDKTCESLVATTGEATNPCGMSRGSMTVAYSPDGQLIGVARGGLPPNVHLWRLSDGVLLRSMGTAYGVVSVVFSPDGRMLAAAGPGDGVWYGAAVHPNTVNVWDVATGALIHNVPAGCGPAISVTFSHDGSLLVTAGSVSPIEIWRTTDWKRSIALGYPATVYGVHFSPDDSKLIATGSDGKSAVWNLPAGTLAFRLPQVANAFGDADFSPDGLRIAGQGADGALTIWNAATGRMIQSVPSPLTVMRSIAWIDDDQLVTTASEDDVILWGATAGTFSQRKTWSLIRQYSTNVTISPDRTQIAVGGSGIAFLPL